MRDFICAIAFPYCVGICPRGNKKRGKKATRGEKAARFSVLGKERGSDTDSGDRVREDRRRGCCECRSREQEGDCCVVNRIATRWQQRAAVPSRGKLRMGHPFGGVA